MAEPEACQELLLLAELWKEALLLLLLLSEAELRPEALREPEGEGL